MVSATDQCFACVKLSATVTQRLAEQDAVAAARKLPIGHRLDGTGNYIKHKEPVAYTRSSLVLIEILDKVCASNPQKSKCEVLLEEKEEDIESWYRDTALRNEASFNEAICWTLKGCNEEVAKQAESLSTTTSSNEPSSLAVASESTFAEPNSQPINESPEIEVSQESNLHLWVAIGAFVFILVVILIRSKSGTIKKREKKQ